MLEEDAKTLYVTVEYRLAECIRDRDYDRFIARYELGSFAMVVGQTVNIEGDPYFIVELGWAGGGAHCYVRVVPYAHRMTRKLMFQEDPDARI